MPKNSRQKKNPVDKAVSDDYEKFTLEEYVQNPIALARIKAHLTQEELAGYLKVSQAYISKIESQKVVSSKMMEKIKIILRKINKN